MNTDGTITEYSASRQTPNTVTATNIGIGAYRRTQWVFEALDASGSMATKHGLFRKTRQHFANEGACKIVDVLENGDELMAVAFDSDIRNITDGLETINPYSKQSIKRCIRNVRPGGRTMLYDTILAFCQLILKYSAVGNTVGEAVHRDVGTFTLVVLTDGEDTASSASFQDTIQILRLISSQLGNLMRVYLIGVKLSPAARSKMRALAEAGGDMATFCDARHMSEVSAAFTQIAIQIQATRITAAY